MKKSITILVSVIFLVTLVSFLPTSSAHAATKPTKVYNQVIKSGKYAYCNAGNGIFRVDLKSGKIKKLVNDPGVYGHYGRMAKKGKYLYYIRYSTDFRAEFFRVKTSGGKVKQLAGFLSQNGFVTKYMIKGKKIYYQEQYNLTRTNKVMKLNGKSKKNSNRKAKWKIGTSNKAGYSIIKKYGVESADTGSLLPIQYWLKVPGGKTYYLGKTFKNY